MMNRLALVGYLAFALVAVSLVNRIGAQTQPVAGLIATAISAGTTGPPSLFADGSAAAPSIAFGAQQNTGIYRPQSSTVAVVGLGTPLLWISNTQIVTRSSHPFAWSSTTDASGSTDTGVARAAAGLVEINNGQPGQRASLTLNNGGGITFGTVTFATLNVNVPAGTTVWCSDCGIAGALNQTCTGAGAGSLAVKNASNVWICFT